MRDRAPIAGTVALSDRVSLDSGSNSEPFSASDTDDRVDDGPPPDTWTPPLPSWAFTWIDADALDVVDECASACLQTQIYNEDLLVSGLNVVFEQECCGFLGEAESDQDGRSNVCVDRLGVGSGRIAASCGRQLSRGTPLTLSSMGEAFGERSGNGPMMPSGVQGETGSLIMCAERTRGHGLHSVNCWLGPRGRNSR